jgi:hypothetical protein
MYSGQDRREKDDDDIALESCAAVGAVASPIIRSHGVAPVQLVTLSPVPEAERQRPLFAQAIARSRPRQIPRARALKTLYGLRFCGKIEDSRARLDLPWPMGRDIIASGWTHTGATSLHHALQGNGDHYLLACWSRVCAGSERWRRVRGRRSLRPQALLPGATEPAPGTQARQADVNASISRTHLPTEPDGCAASRAESG